MVWGSGLLSSAAYSVPGRFVCSNYSSSSNPDATWIPISCQDMALKLVGNCCRVYGRKGFVHFHVHLAIS